MQAAGRIIRCPATGCFLLPDLNLPFFAETLLSALLLFDLVVPDVMVFLRPVLIDLTTDHGFE